MGVLVKSRIFFIAACLPLTLTLIALGQSKPSLLMIYHPGNLYKFHSLNGAAKPDVSIESPSLIENFIARRIKESDTHPLSSEYLVHLHDSTPQQSLESILLKDTANSFNQNKPRRIFSAAVNSSNLSSSETKYDRSLWIATPIRLKAENLDGNNMAAGRRTILSLSAPTNPITDDIADTFDWTFSPNYASAKFYEYTLDGGTLYQPVTAKPQPVGNYAYAVGQVGVRVRATASNYQSPTLFNAIAFFVAPENLLPHSNFGFGFPFYLYNCTTDPAKNISSPVEDPGTYYISSANGSNTEIRVFQYPNIENEAVTYSMYIKPVDIDSLTLKVHGSAGGPMSEITYQFSTQAVVSNLHGSGSVVAISGKSGWYRISFTYVAATKTSGILRIHFPKMTAASKKSFYLAGAQLNRGTTSGTFVVK